MKPVANSNYTITVMSSHEVQTAINWATQEGWNPGINDASAFYAADATGFLVGTYNDTPIATISAVKYGETFGFIGLYIVSEAFRGQGFGLKLWEAAISSLGERNIGLDGVVAQQENYKKSGFKLAHRNIRYVGQATRIEVTSPRSMIVEAQDIPFTAVEKYDSNFFPAARGAFLKNWISPQNSITLASYEQAQMVGYGSIRPCVRGYKIGPLNAENSHVAWGLFAALTARVPEGTEIFLDVPEPNQQAVALAQKCGMTPVFETARMYTQALPQIALDEIYGITTFELG